MMWFSVSKQGSLSMILAMVALLLAHTAHSKTIDGQAERVNLDQFVEANYPSVEGTKVIVVPKNIQFRAKIKRHPEHIQARYVFKALGMMQVNPLPPISHRMFIETSNGKIFSMYVEKATAKAIEKQLAVDQWYEFQGYHVYNYAKGPAIVIDQLVSTQALSGGS